MNMPGTLHVGRSTQSRGGHHTALGAAVGLGDRRTSNLAKLESESPGGLVADSRTGYLNRLLREALTK